MRLSALCRGSAIEVEPDAAVTVSTLREMYGDRFEEEAGTAFELAAHMLGEPELADVSSALFVTTAAVGELRGRLAALPEEIRAIEADNRAKAEKIDHLRGEVRDRSEQIRTRYGRVGLFDRMFSVDVEARVAAHLAHDQELRSLEKEIGTIEGEVAKAVSKVQGYRSIDEPGVRSRIGRLEQKIGELYDALDPSKGVVSLRANEERVERRHRLLAVLAAEIELLESMKRDARAIGVDLDSVIAMLHGAVALIEDYKLAQVVPMQTSGSQQSASLPQG